MSVTRLGVVLISSNDNDGGRPLAASFSLSQPQRCIHLKHYPVVSKPYEKTEKVSCCIHWPKAYFSCLKWQINCKQIFQRLHLIVMPWQVSCHTLCDTLPSLQLTRRSNFIDKCSWCAVALNMGGEVHLLFHHSVERHAAHNAGWMFYVNFLTVLHQWWRPPHVVNRMRQQR